jgi:hypothetical protein
MLQSVMAAAIGCAWRDFRVPLKWWIRAILVAIRKLRYGRQLNLVALTTFMLTFSHSNTCRSSCTRHVHKQKCTLLPVGVAGMIPAGKAFKE